MTLPSPKQYHKDIHKMEEEIYEKKLAWLKDNGYSFKDVITDEDGEYVISISEIDEGEGGDYASKKVYLPNFNQQQLL